MPSPTSIRRMEEEGRMMARDDWLRVEEGTAEEVPRGMMVMGGGMLGRVGGGGGQRRGRRNSGVAT